MKKQPSSKRKTGLCAHYKDSKLMVYQGDIKKEKVDAIVLPITKQRYEEVKKFMPVAFGDVVVVHEEDLPCKMVLYAIVFKTEDEQKTIRQQRFDSPLTTIRQIVLNSLALASKHNAKIISMSAIGPGLGVENCAETTFDAVEDFLEGLNESVQEIRFVNEDELNSLFSDELVGRYQAFEIRISDDDEYAYQDDDEYAYQGRGPVLVELQ